MGQAGAATVRITPAMKAAGVEALRASSQGAAVSDSSLLLELTVAEVFQARGGVVGDPVSDWLQAEAEITAEEQGLEQEIKLESEGAV